MEVACWWQELTCVHLCACLCVQGRERDYYWAKEGDVLPWHEFLEEMQVRRCSMACALFAAAPHVDDCPAGDDHDAMAMLHCALVPALVINAHHITLCRLKRCRAKM